MHILTCESTPASEAPADYFSGKVWQEMICDPKHSGNLASLHVTFAPGARTHWHTHPLGQALYVTTGCGLIQSRGGPIQTIRAGDRVWIPPGEEHWHGAGPDTMMRHVAVQQTANGSGAHWLEPVSDAQYRGAT